MVNIKRTSLPAYLMTMVMLLISSFAVAGMIKNPIDNSNNDKEATNVSASTSSKSEQNETQAPDESLAKMSYPDLAADMLQKIIDDKDISGHMQQLKNADAKEMEKQLDSDEKRLSFWINAYNAYTQYFLKKDPEPYKNDRNAYFKKEQIDIAGYRLSFNDIEHGALRRGATIWSKGHFRIPFRNEFVNRFKVSDVDHRIHFALNCGAKSCPPVSVYHPEKTNEQLDEASCYYLKQEVEYNKEKNLVKLPALMTWFSADFGSKDNKRKIAKDCKAIPQNASPEIEYKDYDWTMKVRNYKQF